MTLRQKTVSNSYLVTFLPRLFLEPNTFVGSMDQPSISKDLFTCITGGKQVEIGSVIGHIMMFTVHNESFYVALQRVFIARRIMYLSSEMLAAPSLF